MPHIAGAFMIGDVKTQKRSSLFALARSGIGNTFGKSHASCCGVLMILDAINYRYPISFENAQNLTYFEIWLF
jgi:hypothetical protein